MRIKKIRLNNIRSYKDQEIKFPEGSLLLAGDIGSGKTTILLAIEYALFGLQPGQKGSALLRNNANMGEVCLEFEIEGKTIIIERKLKRSSKAIANDSSSIIIDGEKSELSTTELKTKILNLLGYPAEFIKKNNLLYKYTVYTPQEQMKQIILEDPETRLNLLGHVFGIDKYKTIKSNLSLLLVYLKEYYKSLQTEIMTLEKEKLFIHELKAFLQTLESKIKNQETDLAEKKRARKQIEKEAQELEKKIKERENFEKELDKTKILISAKEEALFALTKDSAELSQIISESGEIFDESKFKEVNSQINLIKNTVDELNLKYIDFASKINSFEQKKLENLSKKDRIFSINFCPTCLQDVPDFHKHNILNETEGVLVEIEKSLETLRKERFQIKELLEKEKLNRLHAEELKVQLEILRSKNEYLEKTRLKLKETKQQQINLEKDIALLKSHFTGLKEEILKFSKFINLYKIKQDDLRKAFFEEKNSEISLAELNKELEIKNQEINNIEKIIISKENIKIKADEILALNNWLSNDFLNLINFIERNVMIKLRAEFSKLFNKWFHMLISDSLEVQLDENFSPLIIQGETEMDYSFLSGGERTAIALAYRLALNQTINSVLSTIKTKDIVILDEPTDGFSDFQLDRMREVLEELNIGQLIIVSHEQKIESYVTSVIRLKKEGGISTA